MMRSHKHGARQSRARRPAAITTGALAATVAVLALASPAMATPKGIFAVFSDCPTKTPGVVLCSFAQTTGGEFSLGTTKVPINKTITLQGGAIETGKKLNQYFLVPAIDGNSLSKTPLNVPGGLLNLINCTEIKGEGFLEKTERLSCKLIFENGTTGVAATTELVANATNPGILDLAALFFETETALTLPVRVHLNNPLLGSGCYIGSETHPIQLHLTTGTTAPPLPNKPIKGQAGEFVLEEEGGREINGFANNSLVDNAFSAPVAEGCGGIFAFLLDPILDAKLGLPSASGHNTAILNGRLKVAEASAVLASE